MGDDAKNAAYLELPDSTQNLRKIGPLIVSGITDADPKARRVEIYADIDAQTAN
jgi:hypothetical protein